MVNYQSGGFGAQIDLNELSLLTTKGDILTSDGTDHKRLGVGSDGQFLKADSTASNGVSWGAGGVMEVLADDTLSSASASHSVSLDTTDYSQLFILVSNIKRDSGGVTKTLAMTFNNDTGNNYSTNFLEDTGKVSASSEPNIRLSKITDSNPFNGLITVQELDANPKVVNFQGGSKSQINSGIGDWANVNDISSVQIKSEPGDNVASGSRIIVMGVKS